MKIALLSGSSSIHTIRWANGLSKRGVDVHLITQHQDLEPVDGRVNVHRFPSLGLAGYYLMVPGVRRVLRKVNPDLLHVHYASGYGTTARLTGFRPYLLSVWGSDVFDFPDRSFLHRRLVRANLYSADRVASTSHCMAEQVRALASGVDCIEITPFGVDTDVFRHHSPPDGPQDEGVGRPVVIGTVKVLAHKYGVDTLIRAFAGLVKELHQSYAGVSDRLQLRIVGDGPQRAELERLAEELGLGNRVTFVGRVPHDQVAVELSRMDVYVALSRLDSESFGVAVIEAGAVGRPAVVSDAGGLPEVIVDGETGLVVPRDDPEAACKAIRSLVVDPGLGRRMGLAAREHVVTNYSWESCLTRMIEVYESVVHSSRPRWC